MGYEKRVIHISWVRIPFEAFFFLIWFCILTLFLTNCFFSSSVHLFFLLSFLNAVLSYFFFNSSILLLLYHSVIL